MGIPSGADRAPIDGDAVTSISDALNGLAEALLTRSTGPDDLDVEVATQLVEVSSMLATVGAEARRTEAWLKVWAVFGKETGLDKVRNPDVAEFDEKLADDLLETAKATVEWVGKADYFADRKAA